MEEAGRVQLTKYVDRCPETKRMKCGFGSCSSSASFLIIKIISRSWVVGRGLGLWGCGGVRRCMFVEGRESFSRSSTEMRNFLSSCGSP